MSFPDPAGAVRRLLRVVGVKACQPSRTIRGRGKWTAMHFLITAVMGACVGSMGTAMAQITEHQPWAEFLSGALGASGAFGFEVIIRRLLGPGE